MYPLLQPIRWLVLLALLLLATLTLIACSRPATIADATNSPTAAVSTGTTAAALSPTPNARGVLATATADPARAMQHLRELTTTIGARASTTEGERRAAEYVRKHLESVGYQATIEPFEVDLTVGATGAVRPDGAADIEATPMSGSPDGDATGALVVINGPGRAADYAGVQARGAIALVTRGDATFAEKTRAALDAGAVAVVVANNQSGQFRGDLGTDGARIPVVGISSEDGAALKAQAGRRIGVSAKTQRLKGTSQNVVGRPSSAPCTAYLGGHYDSVPAGPGANDNASGTSLIMELSRARRIEGLCVIAFGSEEVGLLGSRAFVRQHGVAGARFMLNFDMVAKLTRPALIGDADLAARASALAAARNFSLRTTSSIGPGASSDHASFIAAGVPALMFYSGDDQFIHTAQDDFANTLQADLAKFLDLAVALLDDLYAG